MEFVSRQQREDQMNQDINQDIEVDAGGPREDQQGGLTLMDELSPNNGSDRQGSGRRFDMVSWGQNSYSELCHGDVEERRKPKLVDFLREHNLVPKQAVAGNEHTALLTDTGRVYCCGYNDSGQCGNGSTNRCHELQLVEALEHKDVQQIYSANGCEHILAITRDGELYSWGYNSRGQLGHNSQVHVSTPRLVESLLRKRVVKVACSYYHTIISTADDELFSMGRNDFGQLGLGDDHDRARPERITGVPAGMILDISCGQYHSIFSIDGVGLLATGKDDHGQLGVGGGLSGEPRVVPVPVAAPLNGTSGLTVTSVSCGYYHTVALTSTGEVYTWGRGDYGQLGLGNKENKRWPHRVMLNETVVQISSGCYHTLLLTEDGKLFAQGRNNHGQLGTESVGDSMFPVRIEALSSYRVVQVAAGFYHSVCIIAPNDNELPAPGVSLSSDLRKLLNNPKASDVVFVVEGRPLYAHRCIIMTRCEPLDRMLSGPMKESQQREIVLPDLQFHVVLALLEFLYTDSVERLTANSENVDLNFALDVLAVADQFLVQNLKCLCEVAIQKSITVENVATMFRTADARQAHALRRRCFEFMQKHFGKVIGTDGFANLPKDLLREVLQAAYQRGVTIRPA